MGAVSRGQRPCFIYNTIIQYTFIAKCQYTDNTLIARGMFCGAKYTHHAFTPIIKRLITTTANTHPGKKSFIDKNMRKSYWHQVLTLTVGDVGEGLRRAEEVL